MSDFEVEGDMNEPNPHPNERDFKVTQENERDFEQYKNETV